MLGGVIIMIKTIKWTEERKRKFVREYTNLNNSKKVIAAKYGLTIESASVYSTNFRKKMKKEL